MSQEIEYKWRIEAEQVGAVPKLPLIGEATRIRTDRREIADTYYDTPEGALYGRGLGFRIRHSGEDWLQTAKTEPQSTDGCFVRDEVETVLDDHRPNFSIFRGTVFEEVFADRNLQDGLRPIFATQFHRAIWELALADGAVLELALDRGAIRTLDGSESAPIQELELELKAGPRAGLDRAARAILAVLPLKPGLAGKAQRGYALCGYRTP